MCKTSKNLKNGHCPFKAAIAGYVNAPQNAGPQYNPKCHILNYGEYLIYLANCKTLNLFKVFRYSY